jgi:hypothetical protein
MGIYDPYRTAAPPHPAATWEKGVAQAYRRRASASLRQKSAFLFF